MNVGGHPQFFAILEGLQSLVLALMYFSRGRRIYGSLFFLPQLVKEMGASPANSTTGW